MADILLIVDQNVLKLFQQTSDTIVEKCGTRVFDMIRKYDGLIQKQFQDVSSRLPDTHASRVEEPNVTRAQCMEDAGEPDQEHAHCIYHHQLYGVHRPSIAF